MGEDAPKVLTDLKTEYIMYVTERIKCKFHPVIWLKSVMEKYYPLEIVEKDSFIEGVEIKYEVDKLILDVK